MIFRRFPDEQGRKPEAPPVRPAFPIFLEMQNLPLAPRAVILQPDHSRLAGEIAQRLRADVFGELPAEVVEAIREHDFGWEQSDQEQLRNAAHRSLRPFPWLSPEETHPAWRESVRLAREASLLKGVIVSRHFCALASQDPAHRLFADEENPQRERIERELNIRREDLDRWTAAIGFCDLLSLYLCSGALEPAEIPLAHSSLPGAREARKVFLNWAEGRPHFTSPLVEKGAAVCVKAWESREGGPNLVPVEIHWEFLG